MPILAIPLSSVPRDRNLWHWHAYWYILIYTMFLLKVWDRMMDERVSCALAGGFAVALHGAVRGTLDIDLVLKATAGNFAAAERALRSLGLESRLPVNAAEVFAFRKEYIEKRNLIAWSFLNPRDATEIVDLLL